MELERRGGARNFLENTKRPRLSLKNSLDLRDLATPLLIAVSLMEYKMAFRSCWLKISFLITSLNRYAKFIVLIQLISFIDYCWYILTHSCSSYYRFQTRSGAIIKYNCNKVLLWYANINIWTIRVDLGITKHPTFSHSLGIYLHLVLEKQSAIMSDLNVNIYWPILVFSTFIVTGPNSD